MTQKIYILFLGGTPLYATTNLTSIEKECKNWFDRNYDNWEIQLDYQHWLEDKTWYPNTDEGEEQAWNDYVSEQFETGMWDDYVWYECSLK